MLMLILIDVQYLQNVLFSFEKGSNGENHSLTDSYHPMKKSPSRISHLPTGQEFPLPLNTVWKTLQKI